MSTIKINTCVSFLWLLWAFAAVSPLIGQGLYVSKYIYGNFTKDDNHYLEIFNESNRIRSLSGYMIVTRNYVAKIPDKTQIQPYSSLRFSKAMRTGVDIAYVNVPDFLIRFPSSKAEGDYVVLFDVDKKILSAVYFSPNGKASFLPDKGELITAKGETLPFDIPTSNNIVWNRLDINPDPAMACVFTGGKWQVTSKNKNLVPATEYATPSVNYVDGIVTLKWQTLFEQDCFEHVIERSRDGDNFSELNHTEAHKNSTKNTEYLYYDKDIQKKVHYFYRIKNTDKFKNTIYSPVVEVVATEFSGVFSFQILEKNGIDGGNLSIRFSSQKEQKITLRVLDERFFEIDILFSNIVTAGSENLIKYNPTLPIGKYFIIAETEEQRLYKEFIVKNN